MNHASTLRLTLTLTLTLALTLTLTLTVTLSLPLAAACSESISTKASSPPSCSSTGWLRASCRSLSCLSLCTILCSAAQLAW